MDITGVLSATPGKEPGPLAFSDFDYLSSVLKNSGFSSVKIDVVETVIRTADSPEQNASLLMEIGMGFRVIKRSPPDMLENIKNAFIKMDYQDKKMGLSITAPQFTGVTTVSDKYWIFLVQSEFQWHEWLRHLIGDYYES